MCQMISVKEINKQITNRVYVEPDYSFGCLCVLTDTLKVRVRKIHFVCNYFPHSHKQFEEVKLSTLILCRSWLS